MFLKPTAHISTPHTSPRLSFHTLCSPLPAGSRPGSSASLHSSKESKSSKSQRREERRFQKAVEKEERRRLKRQVKDKEKAERNQRPNDADNRRSDDAENCHREAGMSLMYMYITAICLLCTCTCISQQCRLCVSYHSDPICLCAECSPDVGQISYV